MIRSCVHLCQASCAACSTFSSSLAASKGFTMNSTAPPRSACCRISIVVVSRDENDRHCRALLSDSTLQFKAVETRQPHISNDTCRSGKYARLEELLRGTEHDGLVPCRLEYALNRVSNSTIVVDRGDEVFGRRHENKNLPAHA
jgi:hypothetical protein